MRRGERPLTLRSSLASQLGVISIVTDSEGVLQGIQLPRLASPSGSPRQDPPPAAHRAVHRQLREYLAGRRRALSLPFCAVGTDFQMTVWAQLRSIPWGETRAYSELARALEKPGAARAVGTACSRNPIPILIPCHRVLSAQGGLGGWTGDLRVKRFLLRIEGSLGS